MSNPSLAALQSQLSNPIITPSHSEYDDARSVWNAMIDRHPRLIVRPENAREVAAAVIFAREHDLELSVKGGGHGVAGRAICDDGLVIDVSRMNGARVDPVARIAYVQGGATLRALDAAAHDHGLATTAGIYRGTGVAGLAIGGGVGLLMRKHGLTCDNLLAAEVVAADGQVLEANDHHHPDLFWALKGGGGNFGVVTRMDFQLHPLTHVLGGRLTYSFEHAYELGRLHREIIADSPVEVQAYLGFSTKEDVKSASVILCHSGNREDGEKILDRFRRFQKPLSDEVDYIPYLKMQQSWDDSFPSGSLSYWKSSFLPTISDEALRVTVDSIANETLPNVNIDIEPMGGAIATHAFASSAFADRDAACTYLVTTEWTDPIETEARIAWVRNTWKAVQPFAKPSTYVNYMDHDDDLRTEATYGANFQRLVEIKRIYDPKNIFRHNANIRP